MTLSDQGTKRCSHVKNTTALACSLGVGFVLIQSALFSCMMIIMT